MTSDPREALREAWLETGLEEVLAHPVPDDLAARTWRRVATPPAGRWRAVGVAAVLLVGAAAVLGAVVLRGGGAAPLAAGADPNPIRVLLLADRPGWDYRFLRNALLRAPGVAAQVWLCSASADFPQDSSPGVPALVRMPAASELRGYDVVLVGDVAPERLGTDAAARAAWWAYLHRFVESGGGLALLAGPGGALTRDAEGWPGWLPARIELDEPREAAVRCVAGGVEHPVLRPLPDSLAPLFVAGRMQLVGDAGVVLLETVDGAPVAVTAAVGDGRVLVSTAGSLWRLRGAGNPGVYDRWWRAVLAWLATREE